MKKIIGGLIVVSLLSRPAIFHASTFDQAHLPYEVFRDKSENQIVFMLKEDDEAKNEENTIDSLITDIGTGTRQIMNLLKEKTRLVGRIDAMLYLHSHKKSTLADNQINSLATFCSYYSEESRVLQENLEKVDLRKNLNVVKKELLNKDSRYDLMYDELKTISSHQSRAIKSLSSIICASSSLLEQIIA